MGATPCHCSMVTLLEGELEAGAGAHFPAVEAVADACRYLRHLTDSGRDRRRQRGTIFEVAYATRHREMRARRNVRRIHGQCHRDALVRIADAAPVLLIEIEQLADLALHACE